MSVSDQIIPQAGGSPVPPVPWTPALLTGIQAWYRADPGLVVVSDGDKVDTWLSIIQPDTRSLQKLIDPLRPTYSPPDQFVNFGPAPVRVLESSDSMVASLPLDMRAVFITFSVNTNTVAPCFGWDNGGDDAFSGGQLTNVFYGSNSVNLVQGTTILVPGTLYRGVLSFDSSVPVLNLYLNGALEDSGSFTVLTAIRFRLGTNLLGFAADMRINEFVISRTLATASDVAKYQTYSVNYFGP
jgi:hypothetical protein